jgi:hypothetical protein
MRPARPHLRATNVIALYTALACSNLVVISADDSSFLLDVLETLVGCLAQLETEYAHLFSPPQARDWPEEPGPLEEPPRIAFITNLGTSPEVRKRELENDFAGFLAAQPNLFVRSIFRSDYIMFVDSATSTFEMARAIAQAQILPLVDNGWPGFERRTADALACVQASAGFFTALLSYVDSIMQTDQEEELP